MMKHPWGSLRRHRVTTVVVLVAIVTLAAVSQAFAKSVTPTPRQVTTTSGGQNQNATIDASGNDIAFTSNATDAGVSTFDNGALGNGFTPPGATHPNPTCVNCDNADANGEIFLWHNKAKNGAPANSFTQITDTSGGGFTANELPDINQKGTAIAWDSDRDITGDNADGNREIFLYDIVHDKITQITNTTGGGENANVTANISDDGNRIAFNSNRDFSGLTNCTMADGSSACDNADGNAEVMIYDVRANHFTQITDTTGGGTSANVRARISGEGQFLSFQSTRDFSTTTCVMADGVTPCANPDGNAEVMRFDVVHNSFIQITNSTGCGAAGANEQSEISKKGLYVTWQSTCEAQLDPGGCGSCDNHDEAFLYDAKKKVVVQLTVSVGGFNRVPRISESGTYIVFESNRNYDNLNPQHNRILYILKRNSAAGKGGAGGPGQLIDDASSTLTQNPKAQVVTINFEGGFNTSVEQFGISSNGKYISFDNGHGGVGRPNQEIWFLDRTK
jgi:Tol biopolymer transport system component